MDLSTYVRAVFADASGAAFEAVEGFDIDVTVEGSHSREPDTAEVTLYNLSQTTRERLKNEIVTVVLYAGKTAAKASQIFKGEVVDPNSMRSEDMKDWVSVVLAEDTKSALRTRIVSRNYSDGTPLKAVLSDLGAAAGVQVDVQLTDKIHSPLSLIGAARSLIQSVCKQYSLRYQVIDGRVYVREEGEPVSTVEVPVISPDTGMIGVPTSSLEKRVVKVTASCELNPLLVAGGLCQIRTTATMGSRKAPIKPAATYWIERHIHSIKTKTEFKTTVVCREHTR